MSSKFVCTRCGKTYGLERLKGVLSMKSTGTCKDCHNLYTRLKKMEVKVEANPHLYLQCENCDEHMNKYTANGVRETCRYCGSSKIVDVK